MLGPLARIVSNPVLSRSICSKFTGLRAFSSAGLQRDLVRIPKVTVTPKSSKELVKFHQNTVTVSSDDLVPLKEAQQSNLPLYAKIHIHNWDLLVTPGDIVKLPVNMKDLKIGDKLNFTECSELGSRTHTLSGGRHSKGGRIDPALYRVKGVVLEKTRVKRSVREKTRRRRRHVQHVVSHNNLTVIRITDVSLN